ncbi:uncharacterized protein LOC111408507 [Olea europaea var. sylvestris]|uniref:uncharacterized protein LOC111408507 n=1 Tax=Olea europaea var. sylvestris TaxID=158386 RepID=UPI000C1D26A9|nr:uncharacterized protein LOC111408507 [Olea europaea var. sylvestris]
MAKSWEEHADLARSCLNKARRRMKKWADKKRRPLEFKVGDQVLVKILPQQFKAYRSVHKGLVRRYEGPFPVIAKVGKVSYRLDLPSTLKIHPVFHVSMLKPYHEDMEDPSRGELQRAPPIVTKSFDKEVDEADEPEEIGGSCTTRVDFKSKSSFNNADIVKTMLEFYGKKLMSPKR